MIRQIKGQIGLFDYSAKGSLLKTYPAGSLLSTDGCGVDDCFSCSARDCYIRVEDRYCRYASLGNPYPCESMTAKLPDNDKCQFINQEIAYHRAGDHQPSPCCMKCVEECENRCRKAVDKWQIAINVTFQCRIATI